MQLNTTTIGKTNSKKLICFGQDTTTYTKITTITTMLLFGTVFGMLFLAGIFSISATLDSVMDFHNTHQHLTKCVGYYKENTFVPVFWYGAFNSTSTTYIDAVYVAEAAIKDYVCKLLLLICLYICVAIITIVQYVRNTDHS